EGEGDVGADGEVVAGGHRHGAGDRDEEVLILRVERDIGGIHGGVVTHGGGHVLGERFEGDAAREGETLAAAGAAGRDAEHHAVAVRGEGHARARRIVLRIEAGDGRALDERGGRLVQLVEGEGAAERLAAVGRRAGREGKG